MLKGHRWNAHPSTPRLGKVTCDSTLFTRAPALSKYGEFLYLGRGEGSDSPAGSVFRGFACFTPYHDPLKRPVVPAYGNLLDTNKEAA